MSLNILFPSSSSPSLLEPLGCDSFLQSNVELKVTLNRSDPSFYMLQNELTKDNDYRFEIGLINLICPVVSLTDSLTPMMGGLCDLAPARYTFLSYDVKTFTIPADTTMITLPRVYNTKVPSRLVCCCYNQKAVSGNKLDTPYLTSDKFKIRSLRLSHNGLIIREFKPTIGNNQYTEDYLAFAQFAKAEKDVFCIDLEDFKDGSTYYSMDILGNCESPLCQAEVILSGYMSIEIEMLEATTDQQIFMVFGLSPTTLDIDMNQNCRFSRGIV